MALAAASTGLGFLGVARWFIIITIIVSIVTGIANGLLIGVRTGDWKPLADDTVGRIVSADYHIEQSLKKISDPNIDASTAQVLKQRIIVDIALLIFFVYLIYKGFHAWHGTAIEWGFPTATLYLALSIATVFGISTLYASVSSGTLHITGIGVWHLITQGIFGEEILFKTGVLPAATTTPLLFLINSKFGVKRNKKWF